MPRALSGLLALPLVVMAPFSVPAVADTAATPTEVVTVRARAAIKNLAVHRETPAGYDRDKFRHWIDADGDCQDTRDEVLAAESLVKVSGCEMEKGIWFSYYDAATVERSSALDIDHLVPLAEAWDSGAKRWDCDTRERYRQRPPRWPEPGRGHGPRQTAPREDETPPSGSQQTASVSTSVSGSRGRFAGH